MSDKVPTSRYVETAERQIQDLLGELEAVLADRDSLRAALEGIKTLAAGVHGMGEDEALAALEKIQALTSSEKEGKG